MEALPPEPAEQTQKRGERDKNKYRANTPSPHRVVPRAHLHAEPERVKRDSTQNGREQVPRTRLASPSTPAAWAAQLVGQAFRQLVNFLRVRGPPAGE